MQHVHRGGMFTGVRTPMSMTPHMFVGRSCSTSMVLPSRRMIFATPASTSLLRRMNATAATHRTTRAMASVQHTQSHLIYAQPLRRTFSHSSATNQQQQQQQSQGDEDKSNNKGEKEEREKEKAEGSKDSYKEKNTNVGLILLSLALGTVAMSYLAVPLYRIFCQQTGYGGTLSHDRNLAAEQYEMRKDRPLVVRFTSSSHSSMPWHFYPIQREVKLVPGQSVLVLYKAENPTEEDIVGIASYNVSPARAALYFHKTECFCFDEQLLPAGEEVELPILFRVDKAFADDPAMNDVHDITLNYTFFRSKDFDALVEQGELQV